MTEEFVHPALQAKMEEAAAAASMPVSNLKPVINKIGAFMHCAFCVKDLQDMRERLGSLPISPAEYSQLDVGWTAAGLQVWCRRHNCNIVHIDFEGQKHPAWTTAFMPADEE